MNHIKKKWNKILSTVLALAVILSCVPVQPIFAADEIIFDYGNTVEMTVEGETSATQTISIDSWWITEPEENLTVDNTSIVWESDNAEVASVATLGTDIAGQKTATITANKAGTANVTCTVTYTANQTGDGTAAISDNSVRMVSETYTGTIAVTVKQKPVVIITAVPETSVSYPNKVTFQVTSIPDVSVTGQTITCNLTDIYGNQIIGSDGNPLVITPGTPCPLEVGNYKVTASVPDSIGSNGESYLGTSSELSYTVAQGMPFGDISSDIQEVYIGQEFTITLPTPAVEVTGDDGAATTQPVEGSYTLGLTNLSPVVADGEQVPVSYVPGTAVTLEADAVGAASVKATFTPADSTNYSAYETTQIDYMVKKIPVVVAWDSSITYEKTYDGTTSFSVTDAPTVNWGAGYIPADVQLPAVTSASGSYEFVLEDANAGIRTGSIGKENLILSDPDKFEILDVQDISVTVNPIVLDINNINLTGYSATGRGYNGTSKAELNSENPKLINNGNILAAEFDSLSLSYEADYYDDNDNKISGNPDSDTTAAKVKFSNIQLMQGNSPAVNYQFAAGTVIGELTGSFVISANDEFTTFTGLDLGMSVNETYEGKELSIYWLNAEGVSILQKEGFAFSVNIGSETEPQWNWSESYTLGEGGSPKRIYAKNTTSGIVSRGAYIGLDTTAPIGQISAQIGEKEEVSITELAETFNTIARGEGAKIKFAGSDVSSKIAKIECIGTDIAWTSNDENAWSGKTPTYTFEVNMELEKEGNIEQIVQNVERETELKSFYYARVTDYAGNVGYISSTGVLLDVTAPTATVEMETTTKTFEGKKIYEGDVNFTVDMEDNNISSGIVSVKAILKKNGVQIASYNTKDSNIWKPSDALNAINVLSGLSKPTENDISATKRISIEGTLANLDEANGYTLQIIVVDKAGHESAMAEESFIIDKADPDITVTDKRTFNGEKGDYFTGGFMTVTISDYTLTTPVTDFISGIEDVENDWVKKVDSATGLVTQEITLIFGEGAPYYSAEGKYAFNVTAKDARAEESAGSDIGVSTASCEEFTLDYTAPTYTAEYSGVNNNSLKTDKTEDNKDILYHANDIVTTFTINEETTYDDSKVHIIVRNKSNEVVMEWKDGKAVAKDSNYVITHEKNSKEFKLNITAATATEDDGYTYEISGTDIAGNGLVSKTKADEENINIVRALDISVPQLIKIVYSTENGEDAAELFNTVTKKDKNGTEVKRDYINTPTTMTFTITEHNPTDNPYMLTSKGAGEQNNQWSKVGTDIYTSVIQVPMYGEKGDEQKIQYTIIDKAGNKAKLALPEGTKLRSDNTAFDDNTGVFTDKYTVDTIQPTIRYEYMDYNPDRGNIDGVDYFKQGMKVVVTVDEHNFNSLETNVALFSQNEENARAIIDENLNDDMETEWESKGDIHTKTFTLKEDDQYDITISGTDSAGNALVLVPVDKVSVTQDEETKGTKLSVAIDKNLPIICDSAKPSVTISAGGSSTTAGNNAGQQLFGGDVTFKVTVYDPNSPKYSSGIDNVIFEVKADNGASSNVKIEKAGIGANGNGVNITLVNKDKADLLGRGKGNTLEYDVTISSSVYNSNNIKLSVEAEDIATNKQKAEADPVSIDTTPPEVTITYDNNDVSNLKYFHEIRTATIEVRERNFSDDCMTFTVNGSAVQLGFTQTSSGTGNGDDATWQATHLFEIDDEYVVAGECKDRIDNEGTVTFKGEATEEFIIDKTLPIIEIEFDNNNAFNENYYDAQRIATVIITEKNFNPDEVEIIGEGSDAGAAVSYPSLSGWSSSGDVHRATLNYSQDALYTLDVEYTDLATNEAEDIEEEEFTVDTTDPEIIISGVEEQMPYSGEVRPEISFSDNNYDTHTITMTRTERENIGVDVTEAIVGAVGVSIDGTGKGTGSRILEDVEHLEENDGIYTLTVNVMDKAGRSTEETITYSVNRFGSVYVYSQDLVDMLQGYYQKIKGDLYITAYNANQLVDDSTKLEITCDGSVVENQNTTADLASAGQASNGGWFEYRFRLDHDDFRKDGCYEITLSDKDEAGNTRTNSDAPVSFYIDATAPMIDSIIGLEEDIVNANEHQIGYVISDAIALDTVAIYVNDERIDKITEFENSTAYENSFTLGAGMRQNVRIVAHDKAGNMVDTAAESFEPAFAFNPEITVSTNFLVRWYANTAAFWGSIGAAAVLSGGAITLGVVRFRKKHKIVEED